MRTVRLTVTVEGEGGGTKERNGDRLTVTVERGRGMGTVGLCRRENIPT